MPDNKKLYAIKVADLIVNNETKKTIEWYILEAFGFKSLLDDNDRLIRSYYFGIMIINLMLLKLYMVL